MKIGLSPSCDLSVGSMDLRALRTFERRILFCLNRASRESWSGLVVFIAIVRVARGGA